MEKKKSLVLSIVATVICIILLFFAVVSVVVAVNDIEAGELPYFLGIGICSSNGSYEGVEKNAVVLAKKVVESELAAKDVVVFYFSSAPTAAKLYLGNIIEVKENGTLEVYLGEEYANQIIEVEDVRGKAVYSIAHLGYLVEILEGRYGVLLSMATTILLLAIIVLLLGSIIGIRNENRVYAALVKAREKNGQIEQEIHQQESENDKKGVVSAKMLPNEEKQEEGICEEEKITFTEQAEPEDIFEQIIEQTEELTAAEQTEEAEEQPMQQEETETVIPVVEEMQQEETEEEVIPKQATVQEETQTVQEDLPKELKNSYLKGSFGTDRVSLEITCSEQEATVMKKLIDLTAKKRNRFGLFTSISNVDEYVLKVWCEWEDVPVISSIVTEVKKRTKKKG